MDGGLNFPKVALLNREKYIYFFQIEHFFCNYPYIRVRECISMQYKYLVQCRYCSGAETPTEILKSQERELPHRHSPAQAWGVWFFSFAAIDRGRQNKYTLTLTHTHRDIKGLWSGKRGLMKQIILLDVLI